MRLWLVQGVSTRYGSVFVRVAAVDQDHARRIGAESAPRWAGDEWVVCELAGPVRREVTSLLGGVMAIERAPSERWA